MSERSLKLVARITGGSTPSPRASNWEGDTPFVTPPDLNGLDGAEITATARTVTESALSQTRMVPRGVLVSCRAPIGHVGTASGSVTFNQGCKSIEPEVGDLRFLAYVLVAKRSEMQALGRGTTFLEISGQQLGDLKVPWPPLPTQRRIADYLDRETAQIDAMAEALDGLVARLEERRDALRDGVLRRVPTTVQLQFVTQGIHTGPFGTQLGRGDYVNDGIPVINPTHIVNASILPDAKVSVSASSADRLQAHRMRAGEIVMARRGDLGRCAVVDEKSSGFICGTGSILISPDATKVDSRFAQVSLSSTDTVFQLEDASVGSTMSNLSESTLRHIRIPFPSLDEQRRIVAHLDAETAKIDAMIAKAGELRALLDERRSALITATVTGQHPVPEEP